MNAFDKIYELTYSPLLTPYNLLDNLKLENYISINFHKLEGNILSEITCLVDGSEICFYYLFDTNQYLSEVYYYEDKVKIFLFNRTTELKKLKDNYQIENYQTCI